MKGVVISGSGSGTGKTTVSSAIMCSLSHRGKVQPYKVGPDFIDPMFHSLITGRTSRNLDTFMCGRDKIRSIVGNASSDADVSIVEGVRGLYEGISGTSDEGSTAEVAKILGFPVILVVDARSLTRSAAAIINGFVSFDRDVNIAGIIFNNVSGPQHRSKLRDAVSRYSGIRIVGMVGKHPEVSVRSRHLGLEVPGDNLPEDALRSVSDEIDTDALEEISESAPDIPAADTDFVRRETGLTAAIPYDESYCFYYQENLDCLKASGCSIKRFSPVNGDPLPEADIYYLGGGYPELHAAEISSNTDFTEGLLNASLEGRPVVGECGGLMTMCSDITDREGKVWKMSGIFGASAVMGGRHGPMYTISEAAGDNPLFAGVLRGHEFHYSEVTAPAGSDFGFRMLRGNGISGLCDGLYVRNSVGMYTHTNSLSVSDWAGKIISKVI